MALIKTHDYGSGAATMRTCPAAYGTIKSPSSVSLPSQLPLTTAPLVLLYYVFWGVLRIHPGKNPHEKRATTTTSWLGYGEHLHLLSRTVLIRFFFKLARLPHFFDRIQIGSGDDEFCEWSSFKLFSTFRRRISVSDRCHLNFRFVLEASPSLKRVLVRRNVRLPIEPPFLLIYSSIDKWRASTAGICKR
jgi:hypothetical protein